MTYLRDCNLSMIEVFLFSAVSVIAFISSSSTSAEVTRREQPGKASPRFEAGSRWKVCRGSPGTIDGMDGAMFTIGTVSSVVLVVPLFT